MVTRIRMPTRQNPDHRTRFEARFENHLNPGLESGGKDSANWGNIRDKERYNLNGGWVIFTCNYLWRACVINPQIPTYESN